jgi:hypothetical protein
MVNLTAVKVSTETSLVPFLPNRLITYFDTAVNTKSLQAFNIRKRQDTVGQSIPMELGSQPH